MYLGDKELGVISFSLQLAVLEYQTAIMRKDFSTADKVNLAKAMDNNSVLYTCRCCLLSHKIRELE